MLTHVLKQFLVIWSDLGMFWGSSGVSKGRYWLVLDGAGSVKGGTGWYLMVLGQKRAVLVGT